MIVVCHHRAFVEGDRTVDNPTMFSILAMLVMLPILYGSTGLFPITVRNLRSDPDANRFYACKYKFSISSILESALDMPDMFAVLSQESGN